MKSVLPSGWFAGVCCAFGMLFNLEYLPTAFGWYPFAVAALAGIAASADPRIAGRFPAGTRVRRTAVAAVPF